MSDILCDPYCEGEKAGPHICGPYNRSGDYAGMTGVAHPQGQAATCPYLLVAIIP